MSPVEQDTIDCEYLAYFEPKNNFKKNTQEFLCNFLFADENIKKHPQK